MIDDEEQRTKRLCFTQPRKLLRLDVGVNVACREIFPVSSKLNEYVIFNHPAKHSVCGMYKVWVWLRRVVRAQSLESLQFCIEIKHITLSASARWLLVEVV